MNEHARGELSGRLRLAQLCRQIGYYPASLVRAALLPPGRGREPLEGSVPLWIAE
jgi:hypothetical protein